MFVGRGRQSKKKPAPVRGPVYLAYSRIRKHFSVLSKRARWTKPGRRMLVNRMGFRQWPNN
jgi:hypothetical protein